MAWCDKTSFKDIEVVFGLTERQVIILMRRHLKRSSFKLWRKRVSGRPAKHGKMQSLKVGLISDIMAMNL